MLVSPSGSAKYRDYCSHYESSNSPLLAQISSTVCPIAESMNFLASAFNTRSASIKPDDSNHSTSQSESPDESLADVHSLKTALGTIESDSQSDKNSTSRTRRQNSNPRTKSSFQLRYPPPTTKQKQRLHIRPKVLLQIHRVCQDSRSTPTYDVLPSVVFAPRIARRFPYTFKSKAGLGLDDLVVVSSAKYSTAGVDADNSDDSVEDDKWSSREIVSAICQLPPSENGAPGRAEIHLSQEESWIGSLHAKGGYEFVCTDGHGVQRIARWVPRRKANRKGKADSVGVSTPVQSTSTAFSFSLLDPCSRRHAVIATMDAQSIDIFDSYSKPSSDNSARASNTTFETTATTSMENRVVVDENLRTLIVVTGIWVTVSAQSASGQNSLQAPLELQPVSEVSSKHKRRNLSLNITKDRTSFRLPQPEFDNTRPSLQQAESSPVIPTSPSAPISSNLPRRTQSVNNTFLRRSSSRRIPLIMGIKDETKSPQANTPSFPRSPATSEAGTMFSAEGRQESLHSNVGEVEKRKKPKVLAKLFGSNKK